MKRTRSILFFILAAQVLCSPYTYAQTGWQWAIGGKSTNHYLGMRDAGDEVQAVAIDRWGNVFTVGGVGVGLDSFVFAGTAADHPWAITKSDSAGYELWMLSFSGRNNFYSAITDASGDLYFVAEYMDTAITIGGITLVNTHMIGSSPGVMYYIAKISPGGTVLWAQNVAWNINVLRSIASDDSDNLYVAGAFNQPNISIGTTTLNNTDISGITYDICYAKYNRSGTVVWAKSFGTTDNEAVGYIMATGNGTLYMTGSTTAPVITIGAITLTSTAGGSGISFLARFDSNGIVLRADTLNHHLGVATMTSDISGRYPAGTRSFYMAGIVDSTVILGTDTLICGMPHGRNMFVAKFDTSGAVTWAKNEGGPFSTCSALAVDRCGKVFVGGSAAGSGHYTLNFDGHLFPTSGSDPLYVVEYDSSGSYVNAITLPSGGDDWFGLGTDDVGNFYLGGDYIDTLFIGRDTLPHMVAEQLFVVKYKYVECPCFYVPAASFTYTVTAPGTVVFTYTGSTPIDSIKWAFGDGGTADSLNPMHTYTAPGTYTACVSAYTPCAIEGSVRYCATIAFPDAVKNVDLNSVVSIYPNPAANECWIRSGVPFPAGTRAELYDLTGRLKKTFAVNGAATIIPLSGLSPGMYLCRIISPDEGIIVRKLMVN
jgi:hypothetical protein